MTHQELIPEPLNPELQPQPNSLLGRVRVKKDKLADTYREAAGEFQARADALEAEHSRFEASVAELDESLETAIQIRETAEVAEREAREALQIATDIYDKATAAKQAYGQKGNEPFSLITDSEISIPEEIDGIVNQHILQLEALLAQAKGGEQSPLHIFLNNYLLAKKDYEDKKKKHDEATRKLTLACQDEDYFRAERLSLEKEAEKRGVLIDRAQKRAVTGRKHIKGERSHQVAADNLRNAFGAMGIMGVMRTGNFRALDASAVIQGEVEA